MGFWDAVGNWQNQMSAQSAVDEAFANGRKTGQRDMAEWCKNLQDIVFAEAADAVGQRVVLDETLEALRQVDPNHWLLVRENRIRIAAKTQEEALKYADRGISTPQGWTYFRRPDGFMERRERQEGEVIGVVREQGGKSTAMTLDEFGMKRPE